MKRSHLTIAITFAITILMASAVAQTGAIKANIPFDFTIAKQTLPAGEYTIKVAIPVSRVVIGRSSGVNPNQPESQKKKDVVRTPASEATISVFLSPIPTRITEFSSPGRM